MKVKILFILLALMLCPVVYAVDYGELNKQQMLYDTMNTSRGAELRKLRDLEDLQVLRSTPPTSNWASVLLGAFVGFNEGKNNAKIRQQNQALFQEQLRQLQLQNMILQKQSGLPQQQLYTTWQEGERHALLAIQNGKIDLVNGKRTIARGLNNNKLGEIVDKLKKQGFSEQAALGAISAVHGSKLQQRQATTQKQKYLHICPNCAKAVVRTTNIAGFCNICKNVTTVVKK